MELQTSLPDYEQQRIAVFAISYDAVSVLARFAEKHGITYALLSDEGSHVIRALGLLNEHVHEQHAFYGIPPSERPSGTPYPGAFLLDEQGRVLEKRFHQSYRERETGAGLLTQGFHARSSQPGAAAEAAGPGLRVRAWLDSDSYRFFQRLWLGVALTIEPGLHVYGRPIPEGYVPLSIDVEPREGMLAGEPPWPTPQPFRIEGLDEQFSVYQGTLTLSLPLTFAMRNAGDQTIAVTLRYQACSASDCLMPSAISLELLVKAAELVA